MTDINPPTNPGDVIVTGQRVRAASPFGPLSFPSKTGGEAAPQVDQKAPEDDSGGGGQAGPTDEEAQCAIPEGRRQWNSDAKAREAAQKFLDKASADHNEIDWENREFGALICEFPDGTVELGEIISGEPVLGSDEVPILYYDANGNLRNPGVTIPQNGCGPNGKPLGFVHSHFAGASGHPSDSDFDYTKQLVDYFGAPSNASVYVIAKFQNPSTNEFETKISYSRVTEKVAAQQGGLVNWVNPNAAPCPENS